MEVNKRMYGDDFYELNNEEKTDRIKERTTQNPGESDADYLERGGIKGVQKGMNYVWDPITQSSVKLTRPKPKPKPTALKRGQIVVDGGKIDRGDALEKVKAMYSADGGTEFSTDRQYQFVNDGRGNTKIYKYVIDENDKGEPTGEYKLWKSMKTSGAVKFRGLETLGVEDPFATTKGPVIASKSNIPNITAPFTKQALINKYLGAK